MLPPRAPFGSLRPVVALGVLWLALGRVAPTAAAAVPTTPTFPGADWERVRPADLAGYGWDTAKLAATRAHLRDHAATTGLVVVDRGRVVFTYGDSEELSYLASARKSVLAMLYGRWVKDGTINLDATLAEIGLDDIGGLLPVEKTARVRDLITARSGVYHAASNSGDDLASAPPRGSQRPGTYMLYSNWDFNAAGAVFERLTQRTIYDEVETQLARPLGFQDWNRAAQRKSGDLTVSRFPAYHLWLSTRDMARIGLLMLNEGVWQGTRVLDREWVREIVRVVTPLAEMNPVRRRQGYLGYGAMWWVWDGPGAVGPFKGAYTARGAIGQWITVMPAVQLVIAHKTHSIYERTTSWEAYERMLELLLEARGQVPAGEWPWQRAKPGSR
jgi:CubicO group peptidase (beta-lactamase class C family)